MKPDFREGKKAAGNFEKAMKELFKAPKKKVEKAAKDAASKQKPVSGKD